MIKKISREKLNQFLQKKNVVAPNKLTMQSTGKDVVSYLAVNHKNPTIGFLYGVLASQQPANNQASKSAPTGVNAPPPSIAKTDNTNTPGVFLTRARQQRDINDVNTTPRNIMDWKDIK